MKTFKTPKGTELRISDIKGKDYLGCDQRVIWFREVYPEGQIYSQFITTEPGLITFRASITVNELTVSTAHKTLKLNAYTDYEKCETMAIGRALALCGFGTQFCGEDLDEGEHVADSPRDPKGNTRIHKTHVPIPNSPESDSTEFQGTHEETEINFDELPPGQGSDQSYDPKEGPVTFEVMEKTLGIPHILKILSQKNKAGAPFYNSISDGFVKYKRLTPKQRTAIEKAYEEYVLGV